MKFRVILLLLDPDISKSRYVAQLGQHFSCDLVVPRHICAFDLNIDWSRQTEVQGLYDYEGLIKRNGEDRADYVEQYGMPDRRCVGDGGEAIYRADTKALAARSGSGGIPGRKPAAG
jgi:hypothetical protein